MLLHDLEKKKLIHPPSWLNDNCSYLSIMGSHAYGCADTSLDIKSDMDIYGFCIPRREVLFPHLAGEIPGFGRQIKRFEQYQQHHVLDADALGGKGREYDFTIFSIVRYFHLCMEGNPSCLDSLFTPHECVIHCTQVGNMVRENRKIFLHKGCFQRYKGYSYSQLHKMSSKSPEVGSKRHELREKYGIDLKYALHLVRLLCEVEQILAEGDLDLRRNSEQLKAIRRGEMTEAEIRAWASEKERQLEELYHKSTLPWGPDEEKIKQLLLNCLEQHYGSLEKCIVIEGKETMALKEIKGIMDKYGI
jgi:predicted nucleotidyltransferase